MPNTYIKISDTRQWRALLVYSCYRLISILLFLGIYYQSSYHHYYHVYYTILSLYFFLGLVFLYCWQAKNLDFRKHVFLSGMVDVFAVSCMLTIMSNLQLGYGILLNVTIAALSILVPGRLAVFFAALASCSLLCGNLIDYLISNPKDIETFYYSGIYGAGFFATAITAWYLANWIHVSEDLVRHQSEELAQLQRINEYIVDRLHAGIIYVNNHNEVKLINPAARKFFNIDEKSKPTSLQQVSPLLTKKFHYFLKKNKKNKIGQTILEEPHLKVHFFSTAVAQLPAVLITLEDMTDIAQQAQQLKLAALGRFSASIAHELRNPLAAVVYAAQLFGEERGLNEEDIRLKQLVIKNCQRMNGVIKNVLQLSRRQKSQPKTIDLLSFLEQFKINFCTNNQCDLVLIWKKIRSLLVVFDESQLDQILVVLCDNVMQHGRDEEGKARIVIDVTSSLNQIIMTVKDFGSGILERHQEEIFEPFFTTINNGTGMGLFIARDLCEINQARLNWVKSEKGTCFSITMKLSTELLI
jgi:two-component system sensor histidine kinase PilS (NtrC family)